ncbi:MAG: hypothetical protein IT442_09560 [Phycisphaeraceae bacterium]|nr:hypothetical protein [Phycisphaeraceae bacterium]
MSISRVVMFSGGVGSWAAARRVADTHGTDGLILLFADTLIEDIDLYRFLDEAAADIGAPLVKVADGRTPFEVFRDVRYLGNTRIAPCSRILKQEVTRKWMAENAPDAVVVLGIDWTEEHRIVGARKGWEPWEVEFPLCERPYVMKPDLLNDLEARGIRRPKLYAEGFEHNNCGGGCVRAGIGQFRHLYRQRPEIFRQWEQGEEEMRALLVSNVTILRDRTGGITRPMTLRELRNRLDVQPSLFDGEEWGGCGCFVGYEDSDGMWTDPGSGDRSRADGTECGRCRSHPGAVSAGSTSRR